MSIMARELWLASLKPGDKVAVEYDYSPDYGYDYVMKTVEHVTSTGQIWLVGGGCYRPDGTTMDESLWSRYGWGDPSYKLVEITPAIEESWKRTELLSRITSIRWHQLGLETLEEIVQVLAK